MGLSELHKTLKAWDGTFGLIIFAYIFPIIDWIIEIILRLLIRSVKNDCKHFMRQIYFMLMGYRLGVLMHYDYNQA